MATLLFMDGPAKGNRIETVEAGDVRWHCVMKDAEMTDSGFEPPHWWVIDSEPPDDDGVEVTRYRVMSIRADHTASDDDPSPTIHTYAVDDG